MSPALFAAMFRATARSVVGYAVGMVFYLWLFIRVYPSFAGSHALNALLRTMPPGLLRVLGYSTGVAHVAGFLAGEFYSLLYLVIMAVFALFTATNLVAHLVDNGSMAHLLATPVSRRRVAATEALVLLSGLVLIGAATTAGALAGVAWWVPHGAMPVGPFVQMNIVGTLVFCVVGGYAFLFSCVAPDERTALGLSTALTMLFYALHVAADLAGPLQWLALLSLFSAFEPQRLLHGQGHFALDAAGLGVAGVLLFALALTGFERRQLSL